MSKKNIDGVVIQDDSCSTGIAGLDEVLTGGLPRGNFYLIQGDPGSGKTTLALQFLLEGVRRGEKTLYITLSETKEELLKVARSHGWSLDQIALLEMSAIESLLRPEAQTTVFHPSEVELTKVSGLLLEEARSTRAERIVFDSLSEFRLMAETPLRYRRQLLSLKQEFGKHASTVLLLDDKVIHSEMGTDPHVLSLAHGVLELEQLSPDYGRSRRRLRIIKMRGMPFREGYHDYVIDKGGLRVFPRVVAAEHRADVRREPVSSGNQSLDDLLDGGLNRGTTTLIMGPAGTGKSTLAMHYAAQLARAGERSMLFAFDEVQGLVLSRGDALGMEFSKHVQSGRITVQQVDPAEISPGEFAHRVREGVDAGCKLVIIDSLNGYLNAMPGERYLYNQLHELSAYLNQQGVVTIFILAQQGMVGAAHASMELTYLADTVLNVRFFEAAGAVRLALSVVKKRSGHHENTIREFKLETGHGVRIGPPLTQFHGVLTGTPKFHGRPEEIMEQSDAGR